MLEPAVFYLFIRINYQTVVVDCIGIQLIAIVQLTSAVPLIRVQSIAVITATTETADGVSTPSI